MAVWERLRAQVLAKKGVNLLRYGSNRGDADLREAVAAYLCDFRGAHCHAEQILIVAGMQQAMLISALAVLNPGDGAWIEDPGFHQARKVFALAGATTLPRPVDAEGIVIQGAPSRPRPRMIYVTPSHQFPLGVTMSLRRRKALLEFAETRGAYILEDDYNAEFRFSGPPLPCLQGLDRSGRVIYAGTMSKILYPSLRLGYLLVPAPLADAVAKLRTTIDQHSPTIDQATLARFISEGFYLSHVRRMRKIYSERREVFIEQFNKLLGDRFTLEIPDAGMHALAWFRSEKDLPLVQRAGPDLGVKISLLSFFCIDAKLPPALMLGFAAWSPAQIREGLVRLARVLEKQPVPGKRGRASRNGIISKALGRGRRNRFQIALRLETELAAGGVDVVAFFAAQAWPRSRVRAGWRGIAPAVRARGGTIRGLPPCCTESGSLWRLIAARDPRADAPAPRRR